MAQPALANLSLQHPAPPSPARRYLAHAIGPDAPPAHAAELRMHGQIKLGSRWLDFRASEWLDPGEGFDWRAVTRTGPLRISGYDRLVHGRGEMNWRLFGLVPVARGADADITRSAIGRLAAESIWVPTFLASPTVAWSENPDGSARAHWHIGDEGVAIDLTVAPDGRLQTVRLQRWGNPDQTTWRPLSFGAIVEEERTFSGLTVPSRLRVGWWFGDHRFAEGEFFRAVVDSLDPVL
ncbi:DUF6544 family protein [Haliangium sp.]|uniref:DUF6544 family protein n=1 Tax=Haliangium sp. TaxID=2663208 RepID=UPI003D10BECC